MKLVLAHGSPSLQMRRGALGLLLSLLLAACTQQRPHSIPGAPPVLTTAVATRVTLPILTPTPFISTARNCLDDLTITDSTLDQPADLILRIAHLQGMGLSTQQIITDETVSSTGVVRESTWWFFPETPGLFATLNGRFEPETCTSWTIPTSLVDQLAAVLYQPAFRDLHASDLARTTSCMDAGGFVLRTGRWVPHKDLYIIECPLENTVLQEITGIIGSAYAYKPSP
jgi:hypothetical protein